MPGKMLLLSILTITASSLNADESRTLFDFQAEGAADTWRSVNDGVMGGRSSGQFKINDSNNLEFFGTLSLENNGGFASVRAVDNSRLGLDKDDSIVLRVRGDGRQYNFNLYTGGNLGGYSYRQAFQTKRDQWVEVRLPVDQFTATWRGRTFPREKLDAGSVKGVGILLGDKKPGAFKLEIDWIRTASDK